jgi:hypothetical protein
MSSRRLAARRQAPYSHFSLRVQVEWVSRDSVVGSVVCDICSFIFVRFDDKQSDFETTARSCVMPLSILTLAQANSSNAPDNEAAFCGMYVVGQGVVDCDIC